MNETTLTARKKDKTLRIRSDEDLHARLKRVAAARNVPFSEIVREGITKHLAAEEARMAGEHVAPPLPGLEGQP